MNGPQPVKAYFLDIDGTLVDTRPALTFAANHALSPFQLGPFTSQAVVSHLGKGAKALLKRLSQGQLDDPTLEAAAERFMACSHAHGAGLSPLFAGTESWLEAPIARAIISNKPQSLIEDILKHLKIRSKFHYVLGGGVLAHKKPMPDQLYWVMEKMRLAPSEVVMVGDSRVDIEAGKRAGTRTCAVSWGFGDPESAEPDCIIQRPEMLLQHFPPAPR